MNIFQFRGRTFSSLFTLFCTSLLLIACSDSGDQQKKERSAASYLTNANSYIKQGQFRAAILETKNAIKQSPTAETIGKLAEIYIALGQYQSVQALLEQNADDDASLNLILTDAYIHLSKFFSAEESLGKVDKAKVSAATYDLYDAKIKIATGKEEEGLAILERLNQQHPNDKEVQLTRFLAIYRTGTPEQSEAALTNLIEKFPKDAEILLTAAKVRFLQKNYNQTEEQLMEALHLAQESDIITPVRSGILNLLSKTLTQQGRFAEAAPFNKFLKEANPNLEDVQTRLENALTALKEGNIESGETQLEKLRQEFPNISQANAMLGLISLEQGDPSKASQLFSESVDPETATPNLSVAAAVAELRLDEKQKALDILETAIKSNPRSTELQSLFGLTAISDSDVSRRQQGAEALEKAISLGASDFRLYLSLAYYYGTKDSEKARSVLDKAAGTFSSTEDQLKIYSSYMKFGFTSQANQFAKKLQTEQASNEAGWLMATAKEIRESQFTSAKQHLNRALKINPKNEKSWFLMGATEYSLENFTEAKTAFSKAIELTPNVNQFLKGLLATEKQLNNSWPEIENAFLSLAKNDAQKATFFGFLANETMASGEFKESDAFLEKFKQIPDTKTEQIAILETRSGLAKANKAAAEERLEDAIAILEETSKRHSENTTVLVRLGNFYLQKDDTVKAREVESKLNALEDKVLASLFSADILIKKGETKSAVNLLNAHWAADKDKRLASAIYTLSNRYNIAIAPNFLDEWLESAPKSPRPLLLKAIDIQSTNKAKALDLYKQVLQVDSKNVPALNNLAWLYQEENQLEKANELASLAVTLAPESPSVLDTAGYIKMKLGEKAAIELLEKAHKLAPESKEIKDHLDQAKVTL